MEQTNSMEFNDPIDKRIYEVFIQKGKLAAIKFCKDAKGWDLATAKDFVDHLAAGGNITGYDVEAIPQPVVPGNTAETDKRILSIIQQKGKLAAIKFCKEATGRDLPASKKHVDELAIAWGLETKKEGCFIATACFGDYNAKEVMILRRYRDNVLLKKPAGRLFVKTYYFISPAIAGLIAPSGRARSFIRKYLLVPLINIINKKQHFR